MATATKPETQRFFGNVEGDQGAESIPLLPTRVKDGAPPNNKWLMHFVEGEVAVRHTTSDSWPYINYRSEVDSPDEYAERVVFGMFFFPRDLAEDATDDDQEKFEKQQARVVGQIDAVLGAGTCNSLEGETLEEVLTELIPLLENTTFVGKIGKERGKKVDPDDESKDAERYPDRNRITFFEHEDTWEAPEASEV